MFFIFEQTVIGWLVPGRRRRGCAFLPRNSGSRVYARGWVTRAAAFLPCSSSCKCCWTPGWYYRGCAGTESWTVGTRFGENSVKISRLLRHGWTFLSWCWHVVPVGFYFTCFCFYFHAGGGGISFCFNWNISCSEGWLYILGFVL